jgi:hypothetical protein
MQIDAAVRAYDEIEHLTGQFRRLLDMAGVVGAHARRPTAQGRTRFGCGASTPERPPFWAVPAARLRRPARLRRRPRSLRSPGRFGSRRGPRRHG